MTTEFKSNLANLAEQLQAVYALFRNATSDDEREAVYRMAGIDLLNMRVELLAALSTAADAERLRAENERLRDCLSHTRLEFDGFAIDAREDGDLGSAGWAEACSTAITAALSASGLPKPSEENRHAES